MPIIRVIATIPAVVDVHEGNGPGESDSSAADQTRDPQTADVDRQPQNASAANAAVDDYPHPRLATEEALATVPAHALLVRLLASRDEHHVLPPSCRAWGILADTGSSSRSL